MQILSSLPRYGLWAVQRQEVESHAECRMSDVVDVGQQGYAYRERVA